MQLPISQDLAARILRFQDSAQFSLHTASDAYSPYWLHHRDQIRMKVDWDGLGNSALMNVEGDSGFYVPLSFKPRAHLIGARAVASRFKSGTMAWARHVSPQGLDQPVHIPYRRAYDICQPHLQRYGPLNETSMALPPTAKGVATEFTAWSGRIPNDHVFLAYHLLRLTCRFDGLPGPTGTVLEIGAGNGNMASLIKHYFPAKRMVIVDLPETLQLSISYLGSLFPEAIFILPNETDSGDHDRCDFLFLTPDQIERIPKESVSLAIKMDSFQEMTAAQIESYFSLFERVLTSGGHSLVVNRVEKAPVASETAIQGEQVNRFGDYPWPSSWNDVYYLNSEFHMLVQQNNVFVRLQRAASRSTVGQE
jgi:putative sugar O-methyltransferase